MFNATKLVIHPATPGAPTAIPVVCPKFKCVQFDLTAIGLSPAASPSAAYPRSPYTYLFTPDRHTPNLTHTTRPNPFEANAIELFLSYHVRYTYFITMYVLSTLYYRVQSYAGASIFIIIPTQFTPLRYTIIMFPSSYSACTRLFRFLYSVIIL